jgi:hypothetical protein
LFWPGLLRWRNPIGAIITVTGIAGMIVAEAAITGIVMGVGIMDIPGIAGGT